MISFTGHNTAKADDKGRVPIPAKFRKKIIDAGYDTIIVKPDRHDPCLNLYTAEEWNTQIQRLECALQAKEGLTEGSQLYNACLRFFSSNAEECQIDSLGRISILNKDILQVISSSKDVYFIGVNTHIEVWNKQTYDERTLSETESLDYLNTLLG